MKFAKQPIAVRLDGGRSEQFKTVEAMVARNVAVHQDEDGAWDVTHVPSGARIGRTNTQRNARKIAKLWERIANNVCATEPDSACEFFKAQDGFEDTLLAVRQLQYSRYSQVA